MKKIFKPQKFCNSFATNISLLILRVSFGLSMALAHGLNKVPPSSGFISALDSHGFPIAPVFAWLAGLAEFLGGILIAIGLVTRLRALRLAITMFVAIFIWHVGDPFSKIELAGAYFITSIVLLIMGGGSFSLDRLIQKYSR